VEWQWEEGEGAVRRGTMHVVVMEVAEIETQSSACAPGGTMRNATTTQSLDDVARSLSLFSLSPRGKVVAGPSLCGGSSLSSDTVHPL
jgi:hypothetical protein